jgi:TRAP-type mannitol/chloroaromatic compound transport system permease small subunit
MVFRFKGAAANRGPERQTDVRVQGSTEGGSTMQKLLLFVDRMSTWVGQAFSFLIVGLTLLITWEVFSRYALDQPHPWAFDAMIMLYGTLFMMAGAYTLAKNSHVRGDVLYGFFPPRLQAGLDLALYFVFFIPGIVAFVWAGYTYAGESWAINEHSNITADGPPIYPFKTVIPVAGALILLQGMVEIVRCVICLKQGDWPSRGEDVQEVDVEKLKEMVHVKDADIAQLDQFVIEAERAEARQ